MEFYIIAKKPKSEEHVGSYRTDFEYDDSVVKDKAPRCPKCGSYVGMLEAVPPLRIHLETWGDDYGDLAFYMSDFLVTTRFQNAFECSGLRGLKGFDSTECVNHKHYGAVLSKPPEYYRASPRVGGAKVDAIASEIEWGEEDQPACDVCFSGKGVLKRWRRIVIDESSWDGSDIFYPYGIPGALMTSSKFFDWAADKYFRNLIFLRASEYAHDFYPWEHTTY